MANNAIKWETAPNSRGNVLTTELNALGDGNRSNAGSEIDNSVNLDKYGMFEINVTFATAPDTNGPLHLYLITAPDGTNYGDGSSSVDPGPDAYLLTINVRAVTSAQRKMTRMFEIPNTKFKLILENQAGFAFPATGSTVELFTSNDEIQ